jgi:hypothetical protein
MISKCQILWILISLSSVLFARCSSSSQRAELPLSDTLYATARLADNLSAAVEIPSVQNYLELIEKTLKQPIPVIPLQRELTLEEKIVQDIAFSDDTFLKLTKDSTGKAYRNEVFGIYPARESDVLKANTSFWKPGECYRVEMYNFALNATTVAIISLPLAKLFQISYFVGMQPELPLYLKDLAIEIATENQRVIDALGGKPGESAALMADTKTALNASRCERSKHLCVAPTFVKDERALWTIVDLTDLRLVGTRWTNLGSTPTIVDSGISERQVQNEYISECYCSSEVKLAKNGWDLQYMITGNDGLRVSDVKFQGRKVIENAKLVDWHVSYSKTDGFGYSDAVGCPYFSSATVVAVEAPRVAELVDNGKPVGFSIEQFYRSDGWPSPCNYQYFQRYEFYNDGRFRIAAANIGRGCGNDGTYRPVFRIALSGDRNDIAEWDGEAYRPLEKEGWRLQQATTRYDGEAMFRVKTGGMNYRFLPGNGRFNDGGRGDNAYVYFTVRKENVDEGESDLPTIGPCCNIDYKQGPEKFIEPSPESLVGQPVVLWYVPQIKNDDTPGKEYCWAEATLVNGVYQTTYFPCIAGPMFVPENISNP